MSFLRAGTALSHSVKILLPPPVFILQSLSLAAFGLKNSVCRNYFLNIGRPLAPCFNGYTFLGKWCASDFYIHSVGLLPPELYPFGQQDSNLRILGAVLLPSELCFLSKTGGIEPPAAALEDPFE